MRNNYLTERMQKDEMLETLAEVKLSQKADTFRLVFTLERCTI